MGKIQAQYLKTQPLHHSQALIQEGEEKARFSLTVGITTELIMDLLSFGDQVEVIEPVGLRKQMADRLASALKIYQ